MALSWMVGVMVLTAWEAGVGSNWVGFFGLEDIKPLLKIPGNLDVLAIVPFGYPDYPVGKGFKKRKSLAEVVSKGHFGQPFA
jgi:nitroreductase